MSSNYTDVYAVCPFYRTEFKNRIVCEGFLYGTTMQTVFVDRDLLAEYRKKFCDCMGYDKCMLYKAIAKKYEER